MAITEGVRRLVRAGTRIESQGDRSEAHPAADRAPAPALAPVVAAILPEPITVEEMAELASEPGMADIEAAVAMVESGMATRVVLTNFASWPGLLWQAYQLAEAADVVIIPTVVHPGGRVDIAVTRTPRIDG